MAGQPTNLPTYPIAGNVLLFNPYGVEIFINVEVMNKKENEVDFMVLDGFNVIIDL